MATRTRDSAAPGKEKRGASPSNVPNRKSPAQSSDPNAHVPNYLKPTASSGPDASKQQGKKPVVSDAAQRQNITRRRSFDVPPSFNSRTQKSRISPNPTLRSSSFQVKAGGSNKPVQDKNPKGAKDVGKQRSLYARPVQKMKTIYVKKESSSSSAAKENVTTPPDQKFGDPNVHDVPEPEKEVKDQELAVAEAEEQNETYEINDEKIDEFLVKEDPQEQIDVEKIEPESQIVANTETVLPPTVLEHKHESLVVKTEDPEDKAQIEETSIKQQELEHTANDLNSNITDEVVPNKEVNEKEGEDVTTLDKKEENVAETEAPESKETGVVQEVTKEEKKEPEKAAAIRPKVVVQGDRRDSALSNDVIEETASKLREQRKNKVKALAGAFETVISLQDP